MRPPPHHPNERASNDFFLGGVKIQPSFEAKMEDQVLNILGGTGQMHLQLCYRPQQVTSKGDIDPAGLISFV